ncbi:MAG: helix-turn-helix transcriptional regulator [Spirochaetia bacterium]|nr:helix-turn-helix transcriptional regulator [Spirochaetia bacterium]
MRAGVQAFSRQGYDGATTRDIARLAKANESLIIRYFGGKKGLFEAILVRGNELATNDDMCVIPEYACLQEMISGYVMSRCSLFARHADFMRVAVTQVILHPDVSGRVKTKFDAEAIPELMRMLERFRSMGQLGHDVDTFRLASSISSVTFAMGFMQRIVHAVPEEEIEKTVNEFAKLLARGARPETA